jgi:hypothetical protein
MKSFDSFVQEGKVRKGSKNISQARSLMVQAELRFADVKSLKFSEKNASFRFEDVYESVREAVQACMALQGFKPYSHEAVVAFAQKYTLLQEQEISLFDRFRKMRNNIAYRGERVTIAEVKEILMFAKNVLPKIKNVFKQKI